jgi:SAM-dependent methyltransferase
MIENELSTSASRFATLSDIQTPEFKTINDRLDDLNKKYTLSCHADINETFFPWSVGMYENPQIYAARLWEYPYAILSAELEPGLSCADVGCGMTPFSLYLKEHSACDVTGFDPDLFSGYERKRAFGVGDDFLNATGLRVIRSKMEGLAAEDNSFYRVFCISVIEHVEPAVAYQGIQEMARILKPGGLAVITCDVNLFTVMNEADPFSLIWESGLEPSGALNLTWPEERLGIFFKRNEPADVFGFVLKKTDHSVKTAYSGTGGVNSPSEMPAYMIPRVRRSTHSKNQHVPLSWRQRMKRAISIIIKG